MAETKVKNIFICKNDGLINIRKEASNTTNVQMRLNTTINFLDHFQAQRHYVFKLFFFYVCLPLGCCLDVSDKGFEQ